MSGHGARLVRRALVLTAVVCVCSPLAAGGAATHHPATSVAAGTLVADAAPTVDFPDAAAMQRELHDLSDAWRDGGGTYGYPFWEKAQQRWSASEISASVFREYVTGYRDRLGAGCDLLDSVDTSTDTSNSVHELVVHACTERRDGLRAQKQWLDDLIERDALTHGSADDDARAKLDATAAEHEARTHELLERSFRDTRTAMDQAQTALDATGIDRLREDAFI